MSFSTNLQRLVRPLVHKLRALHTTCVSALQRCLHSPAVRKPESQNLNIRLQPQISELRSDFRRERVPHRRAWVHHPLHAAWQGSVGPLQLNYASAQEFVSFVVSLEILFSCFSYFSHKELLKIRSIILGGLQSFGGFFSWSCRSSPRMRKLSRCTPEWILKPW